MRDSTVLYLVFLLFTYILHNNSRSENNQATKFGQLLEYNMANIFLEKSYTKCGGETRAYSWINSLKFYTVYACLGGRLSRDFETKVQTTWFYLR